MLTLFCFDRNSPVISRVSKGPFVFKIGFRAQLSRGTSGLLNNKSPAPSLRYSLLAAFNFGPGVENLYLILSESQIFLTDSQRVLWFSPHMTIADTNWHQLVLTAPAETNGNDAGTGLNELNGQVVESGLHVSECSLTSALTFEVVMVVI